jgi:hypothetical protein
MHAQVTIGDSPIMIGEESEMAKATTSSLYLYVPDVDSVYQRAIKAGGNSIMEPTDMFYGDRSGAVKDPSGNSWFIATHKEDVAPQELAEARRGLHETAEGQGGLSDLIQLPSSCRRGELSSGNAGISAYRLAQLMAACRRLSSARHLGAGAAKPCRLVDITAPFALVRRTNMPRSALLVAQAPAMISLR